MIPVCLSAFDWALYQRNKGAVSFRRIVAAPSKRFSMSLRQAMTCERATVRSAAEFFRTVNATNSATSRL
jgi:hypothetical protein